MNELLQYLNNNIGKPIFIEDFYQTFPSYDKRDLNNVINDLISKGFIYTFNNAFYLTKYGQDVLRDPSAIKDNPYTKARQKGITYQNRDQFLNKWLKHFLGAVEVFRQNHPELKNLFDTLGVKAEDSVTRFHDANEFVKDVQAIFNRFDFTTPELRYAPKEVDYNIPENLMSIEHAIAESLNRLMQYSPRHTSYITDPRKYREVYDKVDNFLSQEDIQSFLVKNLELKDGTFVKKDNVKSQLIQLYVKTNRGENLELVKISFEQLNNKVNNIIKSISPNLFFEEEDYEDAADRLYQLIFKEGVEVLNNFSNSASSPSKFGILNIVFRNRDFSGTNLEQGILTGIFIASCNFTGADLSFTKWENSIVLNNNFQNANFQNANFREISEFKGNNIEGANFENASISPLIDKNVNIGEPLNLKSLVVTKEEMKERGFRGKESFNHVGVSYDKKVPGYTLDAKGEDWVRYVYATQDAPFPKELFEIFKLHSSVPGDYSLGWIGGKWYNKTKTLYVTEMQSDLLQRTYELNNRWLDEAEAGRGGFHASKENIKILRGLSQYKSKLENYYDGWQYVFFNQAVREAKERGARFIATPTAEYYHKEYSESPYQYYDQIVQQKVKDPETGEVKTEPKFPYREEGHWRFIKVDQITKWATLEKLSWKDEIDIDNYKTKWIWENIDTDLFWEEIFDGSYDNFIGYTWDALPGHVQEEFKQALRSQNVQSVINKYFRKIPLKKSKLSWKEPPLSRLKVLVSYDGRNKGYFCFTETNELVLPEVLTNDLAFHGLRSRKGTQLAQVVEENINVEFLAREEVKGFFGKGIENDESYFKLVEEKMKYVETIIEDIQHLDVGEIIEQVKNPENGSAWYGLIGYNKLSSLKFSADEPSEAQIEAGNYKKDHIRKDGFDITIENKKGSTRSGTDPDGNEWSIKMKHDYGYIKGTVGKDKDHVDCILADNYKEGNPVFIVNQLNDKGNFDEHKCVMGAKDKEEAEKIYLDNYEKGWDQYEKDLVEMTIDEFKDWVMDKKETKKKANLLKLSWDEEEFEESYFDTKGDISHSDENALMIILKTYEKSIGIKNIEEELKTNSILVEELLTDILEESYSDTYLLKFWRAFHKAYPQWDYILENNMFDSEGNQIPFHNVRNSSQKLSWDEEDMNKKYWVYNRDTGIFIREGTLDEISQLYKISPAFLKRSITQNIGIGGIYILDPNNYERKPLRIKNKLERESETKGKKIIGINIETGTEYSFNSVGEAAREIGVSRSAIFQALKRGGNAGGYKWKYVDSEITSNLKLSWAEGYEKVFGFYREIKDFFDIEGYQREDWEEKWIDICIKNLEKVSSLTNIKVNYDYSYSWDSSNISHGIAYLEFEVQGSEKEIIKAVKLLKRKSKWFDHDALFGDITPLASFHKLSWKELDEDSEEKELEKRLEYLREKKQEKKQIYIRELLSHIEEIKESLINMYTKLREDESEEYDRAWAENIVEGLADESIIEEYLSMLEYYPEFSVRTSSLQHYALDEVYWKTYIEKYIETFIRTQERLEPGLGSKKELAKDAFTFMMDEIPEEVKRDPQFPQLITGLRESLIEKGIGDIFDNTPSYLDRTQRDDGDQLIDPEGNPIEETTNLERLNFEEPEEETEDVNTLLDQLSKAKEEGDQEKINEIKRKLDRIIGLSSLSFRKNSWKMFDFKVLKEDEVPWSMKAGGRRGQINTTYDKLLQVLGTPTRLSSPDDKIQAEWVIYFPEQDEYAWVYDYRESIPREEVTDWHIGGDSRKTLDLVKNVLGLFTVEEFNIGASQKLSWSSGKDSYKDLHFNYNTERGQQLDEYEVADGDSSALNPLEMQQIYDTDFFEPYTDKWDKENESLSDPTRNNLQFGM